MSIGILLMPSMLHEISTPVTYIKGNIEYLQKIISGLFVHLDNKALIKEDEIINEQKFDTLKKNYETVISSLYIGAKKASEIIITYRNYLTKEKEGINRYDVTDLIESSLELIHGTLNPSIKIEKFFNVEAVVLVNKNKFEQVITNLILNAVQSINDKGIVSIATKIDDTDIFISIKDNGKGISKQNLKKIFDPFFTTKNEGNMGLGLYVSSLIIREFGGKINVVSEENKGSTFTIILPKSAKK